MTTKPTQLRFLLSLGNTKMIVLNTADDLHVYSNYTSQPANKCTIAAEHVTEALLQ